MVQTYSQNQWPAFATTANYVRFQAAGNGWWAANDDVAVVFGEFIERFATEIEPLELDPLQCWSFANRLIRDQPPGGTVSNHGSATAIDLNSLKHPRGVHNTFSPAERQLMHALRDDLVDDAGRPVLRLGMDYTQGTIDDMHVEIDGDRAQVAQAARRIVARRRAEAEELMALDWHEEHEYTAADAVALGDPKREGEKYGANVVLRGYTPALARLRRELDARLDAIDKRDVANQAVLTKALAEIKSIVTPAGAPKPAPPKA